MAAAPARSAAYGGQVRHQISRARFQDIAQDRDPLAHAHPDQGLSTLPSSPAHRGEHRAGELAAAESRGPRVVPLRARSNVVAPVSPQRAYQRLARPLPGDTDLRHQSSDGCCPERSMCSSARPIEKDKPLARSIASRRFSAADIAANSVRISVFSPGSWRNKRGSAWLG